jgi:hypothetical protein
MAKATKSVTSKVTKKARRKRPGVHSKKKSSGLKMSKNYLKKYKGQGA